MTNREKEICVVLAMLIVEAILVFVACITEPAKEYPTCATVVELDRENDEVVVEDFNGNLWAFEGCEDWAEGDICAMIMNDEGTSEIYDDTIVQVRYCGYNY